MTNPDLRTPWRRVALLAILAFGLGACVDSDEPIVVDPVADGLFDRYVALGNSITAGFMSGGINLDLQAQAYPVRLAELADAPFGIPALSRPGCPPPIDAPLGDPIADVPCAVPPRTLVQPPVVQNLAVPGANTSDLSDPLGTGTPLNAFILGGRTQIGAMIDADPTLLSVWIGNNDALGAALTGTPALLTPVDQFQSEYDALVAGIMETETQDVILIGVAQAPQVVPALQPGAYFWALAQDPSTPIPLDVADNCAPFTGAGATNMVSFLGVAAQLDAGIAPVTVDCVNGMPITSPETGLTTDFLLDPADLAAVTTRVDAFNAYIQQVASANGWIYVDPNTSLIGPALADPDLVRKCQALADPTIASAADFMAAVMSSCPVDLDPTTEETFFGSYFSYDGVHPAGPAHAVIADTLAQRLNAKHGLSIGN